MESALKPSPAFLVGTKEGAYHVAGGRVSLLSSERNEVTALAGRPDGELWAGTTSGHVFVSVKRRTEWNRLEGPARGAIVSILRVPGQPRRWWFSTARGWLLEAREGAGRLERNEDLSRTPSLLRLLPLPAAPPHVLFLSAEQGALLCHPHEGSATPCALPEDGLWSSVAAHPLDPGLWIAGGSIGLWRTVDRGKRFVPVTTDERVGSVRGVVFTLGRPFRLFAWSRGEGGADQLWMSEDGGQTLERLGPEQVDASRDPTGEITALATFRGRPVFGTSRGELVLFDPLAGKAETLSDGLPPVCCLLPAMMAAPLDPATSGIHLLP